MSKVKNKEIKKSKDDCPIPCAECDKIIMYEVSYGDVNCTTFVCSDCYKLLKEKNE